MAQITIGSSDLPQPGILLQINNIGKSDGKVNSTGGVLMPRVALDNLRSLKGVNYNVSADPKIYTGLVVYNMATKVGAGLYVWDGEKWASLTGGTNAAEVTFDASNIIVHPSKTKMTLKVMTNSTEKLIVTGQGKNVVTYTSTNDGKGNFVFVFTSNTSVYGNETYTFKVENTEAVSAIVVNNLNLVTTDRPLRLGNDVASSYESKTIIEAIGGNSKWKVISYSGTVLWDLIPSNVNGALKFKLKNSTGITELIGSIIIGHETDPNLTKKINIVQNKAYIKFPDYDFMVIKYSFQNGNNLDTYTELMNTGDEEIDGKAMSPPTTSPKTPIYQALNKIVSGGLNIPVLKFGGEINTNSAPYEETLIYSKYLSEKILNSSSPKVYDIKLYATWWNPQNPTNNKVKVQIFLYKGGNMVEENNTFVIKGGGVKVYEGILIDNYPVGTYRGNGSDQPGYRTAAQNLGHLEYEWQNNNSTYIPPSN